MRLARAWIRSYRCLREMEVEFSDYTVLIGPNGSGKSSVLYALDWFFNGGEMSQADVWRPVGDEAETPERIEVEVEFVDLDEKDREVLGRYGRGETARFRRSWSRGEEKKIGNSLQGSGFAQIRQAGSAAEAKAAYQLAREEIEDLPRWTNKADSLAALDAWEADPANSEKLVEVDDAEANHLFGFAGDSVLARRFRMILVPASADLAVEVSENGRGSILSQVLGTATTEAVARAKAAWEEENKDAIEELESSIRTTVAEATKSHEGRINTYFREYVANAEITFRSEVPEWSMRNDATVLADVIVDDRQASVHRQGHGIQRAVMISALQSLLSETEDESAEAADLAADASTPAFLLALEEPEIYQHPVRARHFARVLANVSSRTGAQVAMATHSPYFVRPDQFPSLRRFVLEEGSATSWRTSPDRIEEESSLSADRIARFMEREASGAFSEGFFADLVVLVEGATDKAILETMAEQLGTPLDALGISAISVDGKNNLHPASAVLTALGVPNYVVADGDGLRAARNPGRNVETARGSHQAATEKLLGWLPTGEPRFNDVATGFDQPTSVTSRWTLFHDDLEAELQEWDGFEQALDESGSKLRDKSAIAYRNAAWACDIDSAPAALVELIGAMRDRRLGG
ncbi:MAG: AAA family ATPase [Actinomycetota bacterium]